ncbi:uncharacterized protein LOC132175686 [Corylus avellana]|uniref:uncharacterized protein LOC132175686 n=1 Tax=Corylus avellana TaxID=13451 RepID=UPI00286D6810|nr:uncharacterized protein LOC132175686 [Corylus avellana]
MNMGKTAVNQILAILAYFLSFGFFPFLFTLAILILSTILLIVTFKKKKVILDEKPVEDEEGLICEQKNLPGKGVGETLHQPPLETAIQTEVVLQNEVESTHDVLVPSDSESSNDSVMGEKFDLNLICSNYMEQNLAMSDVSASDEDDDDSLIEICLPGSKSGGLDEEPKQKLQSNLPDLLPESIFEQQGLLELLAEINEMNEEENLIEIDLGLHPVFKVND